ncbi:sucrase ferredoxin [Corynebacterium sp. HS2168-gen11]|uniref:sucrase ferredoxin n=1 Tax=Corynebacterium sp. HS2168-gen11 TaxID=2974027 RepID=UPI00216AB3CD|nr:sucrase ferredoxin [Corynebacterium sp. HS2168-gen11]MCS4535907.1 sucrase ferredoxin [Corynebacterium sp. HS2168-gen11]
MGTYDHCSNARFVASETLTTAAVAPVMHTPVESEHSSQESLGYDPFAPEACGFRPLNPLCSDTQQELLPGSSRVGTRYILLEYTGSWSHDIFDGETFTPEETMRLQTLPHMYLLRKPGREGHAEKLEWNAYIVFCDEAIVEHAMIQSRDELFALDFSAPGKNQDRGFSILDEPVLLICTHAKRDRCCAIKGRPIAKTLVHANPKAHIWECSHTKGHRFAPSMVLFPWGYYYGRLNAHASQDVYSHASNDQLFLPGNRGRGIWDAKGQVAEIAVREYLYELGEQPSINSVRVVDSTVVLADGRQFEVTLEYQEVSGVIPSCGADAKQKQSWVATAIKPVSME